MFSTNGVMVIFDDRVAFAVILFGKTLKSSLYHHKSKGQ